MTMEYLREYRTLAHIGASYDIAESNVQRTIKWVENVLVKDGTFRLPGKKALIALKCEDENFSHRVQEKPENHLCSFLQRQKARFQTFHGKRDSYA